MSWLKVETCVEEELELEFFSSSYANKRPSSRFRTAMGPYVCSEVIALCHHTKPLPFVAITHHTSPEAGLARMNAHGLVLFGDIFGILQITRKDPLMILVQALAGDLH